MKFFIILRDEASTLVQPRMNYEEKCDVSKIKSIQKNLERPGGRSHGK